MSDEPEVPTNAERFRKMAERIDHNKDAGFGGACVIIPPSGAGDPIEILMLDNSADLAQFFSTVATRVQRAVDEASNNSALASGFGRR